MTTTPAISADIAADLVDYIYEHVGFNDRSELIETVRSRIAAIASPVVADVAASILTGQEPVAYTGQSELDWLKKEPQAARGMWGYQDGKSVPLYVRPAPASDAAEELQFNAQRRRSVAKLCGLGGAIPEDDATLDGARGAVLGQIAALAAGAPAEPARPAKPSTDLIDAIEAITMLFSVGVDPRLDDALENMRSVIANCRAAVATPAATAAPEVARPDLAELITHIDQFPEINMGNYGDDEVLALNNWGVELIQMAAPKVPTPPTEESK